MCNFSIINGQHVAVHCCYNDNYCDVIIIPLLYCMSVCMWCNFTAERTVEEFFTEEKTVFKNVSLIISELCAWVFMANTPLFIV